MAKKNQENVGITFGSDFDIDEGRRNKAIDEEPYVNCLRKETIIVRHINKATDLVSDKKHLLYGGMARDAVRSYVVRKTQTGYVNFLTKEEQMCLEDAMGLQRGTLNPAKTIDNFWSEKNKNGLNRVVLHRQDNRFDLSVPADYIAYKILLSNDAAIAPSQEVLETKPKATYEFVIISEETDTKNAANRLNNKKQAWIEVGRIQDDADRMRVVLSTLEKKAVAPTTKIAHLQDRLTDYVDANPKKFLDIVKDKYFDTKVTIQKALDRGIIYKKGNFYYDKESNSPLCEPGEDPTIGNVCKYLNAAKNDNIKFSIEAKITKS